MGYRATTWIGLVAVASTGSWLGGQTRPAAPAAGSPALQVLSDQTEACYQDEIKRVIDHVRGGVIDVRVPIRSIQRTQLRRARDQLNVQADLLNQLAPRLSPSVVAMLRDQQAKFAAELKADEAVINGGRPDDRFVIGKGLLMDRRGNVLVPVYVDAVDMPAPLPARTAEGKTASAAFVGSDPVTGLTVMRLSDPSGEPVTIAKGRPADGSLAVVVSAARPRLVVWASNHVEPGLTLMPDGSVSGFGSEDGHFLAVATAQPVFDQLVATGHVRRALLGIRVREVGRDDPARGAIGALGQSPALRVTDVRRDSAADKGGLKIDDLILSVAGRPVGDAPVFAAVIAARDGATPLSVVRGGRAIEVTVEMKPDP